MSNTIERYKDLRKLTTNLEKIINDSISVFDIEIIGNIHENANLLT